MTESEKRSHRVCITGHRPEKLTRSEIRIKKELEHQIRQAIAEEFTVFITGMARGIDIWAAQIVLTLREDGHRIKLICACPYPGFEKNWNETWKAQVDAVLEKADLVKYICQGYSRTCFQRRNEWMVDHAAKVIAVFNGEKGGTKNTIDYAMKLQLPISYIEG